MLADEIIDLFAELHAGNLTAYGTEHGSCERTDYPDWEDYVRRIENHLLGIEPMGVYPMRPQGSDWLVRWGCVDFDEGEHDSRIHAWNLQAVLREFDITSWVCRSRSKGFHVWVYAASEVDAALMRRALLAATQIARAPLKEINPKQERLEPTQLGNYVRLEYPGHLGAEPNCERRVAIVQSDTDPEGEMVSLEEFTLAAYAARVTADELKRLRPLYREPQHERRPRKTWTETVGASHNDTWAISPLARHILQNGPYTEAGGHDRSAALWKVANLLREDGLGRADTLHLVSEADQRWGKHHERNTVEYLHKMVDKVYGQ